MCPSQRTDSSTTNPPRGSVRDRDFRLFFGAFATSAVGTGMLPVALSFAVLEDGYTATELGFVLAAQTVPLIALLLVGGVAADRYPRKTVMVAADALRCGAEIVLTILVLAGAPTLTQFIFLSALLGVGQAFFNPALSGLLPLILHPGDLHRANALKGVAASAGQLAGPAIAGVMVAAGGAGWAIGLDAATYLVSVICLALLRTPQSTPRADEGPLMQLRRGWGEFTSRTWLWVGVTQISLFHLVANSPFLALGAALATHRPGGPAGWGLILAGQGVGAMAGGLTMRRIRPRRPLVVAITATIALAAPIALVAADAPLPITVLGAGIAGAGIAVYMTLWETTIQHEVPTEALSRVGAYDWLGSYALKPLGFALAGIVAARIGATTTLWVGSAWTVLGAVAVLTVPSVRHITTDTRTAATRNGALPRP